MATWTSIPDSLLEPGKPIRSVDALALRDNPIAIAEGAAGAPKVTENAMNLNSINGNRIRTSSLDGNRLINRSVDQSKLAENNGTRDWVGRRNAALGAGAVGTYAHVRSGDGVGPRNWNTTISGSSIALNNGSTLSGTWRVLSGSISTGFEGYGLVVRIS